MCIRDRPSGNIRKKIYDHSELCFDEHGNPVIDPKTGRQKDVYKRQAIITAPLFTAPPYSFINSSMGIFLLSSLLDSPAGEICMDLITVCNGL